MAIIMRRYAALLVVNILVGTLMTGAAKSGETNASAAPADKPLTSLPYTPGLDLKAMDRSAQACTDFYQYSCGGWIKNNPIPGDQAGWSVYGKLNNDNEHFLWGILDGLAADSQSRTPTQQLIGDYFAACMDEAAVEAAGAAPLQKHLRAINAMTSKADLAAVLADLQMTLDEGGLFFRFSSNQDFANSSRVIAFAAAGGLGLPDRDYYTKKDDHSVTLRHQYVAHVARMFLLLGDAPAASQQEAETVMRMETALAEESLTRVESREPHNLFHKMNAKQLEALTPAFDWDAYLKGIGMANLTVFNVTEPKFYTAFNATLNNDSLADIKTYLRWQVAHETAPYLSSAFVNENFEFFSKTLRGVPELKPRWKRCVRLVDGQLGEALGREFVRRTFGPKLKANTLTMTRQIETALQEDLETLSWMSPATKKNALEKLRALTNKIGYPDQWRDYSAVHVSRTDFLGNVERAERFESRRQLAKIGKPVDRAEWQMTPPTINAYYDPQMNDINFPAGVLQPPLYDPKMDDAPNYGDTGGTIGHELTHGFDDEGRQFDARGNLRDWWTAKDSEEFESRAKCVTDQYAQYTVVDDIKINSKLTEGEDIADLGGLVLAWTAWQAQIAHAPPASRDGFSPEQRFFIGYAQWACENTRPDQLRAEALTDPHSPGKYRVNGLVVNMPQFAKAFSCKVGEPMVKEKPCKIW
jgi:endothelin-converting enzyme/putative endopeptidase